MATIVLSVLAFIVSAIGLYVSILGYKVRKDNTLFRKFGGNELFWEEEIKYFIKVNSKYIIWSKKDQYVQQDENGKKSRKWMEVMAKHKFNKLLNMVFDGQIDMKDSKEKVLEKVLHSNLKPTYFENKKKNK